MLKHRSEFLRVRNGLRWATAAFVIEAKSRDGVSFAYAVPPEIQRFGLTVTKQIGSAVVRNRVRRRLREALRKIGSAHTRPGFDYVLIARAKAGTEVFADLMDHLVAAFRSLHDGKGARRPRPGSGSGPRKKATNA